MLLLFLTAEVANPDRSALATREVQRQGCRSSAPAEILIRGRARDRYRTADPGTPFDVHGNVMSVARERSRWNEGGEAGPGSCSAVGPGGWTGCMVRQCKKDDLQNPTRKSIAYLVNILGEFANKDSSVRFGLDV